MSDNDDDLRDEDELAYSEYEEDDEDEEEDEEEDDILDSEIKQVIMSIGQSSESYIDSIIKISPETYEKIVKKDISDLKKRELLLLLRYRYIVQHIFNGATCKVPFNIENIITNAKVLYGSDTSILKIDKQDALIEQLGTFVEDRLPSAFALNLTPITKEIYSQSLLLTKIVIYENLSSKKVIGQLSQSMCDYILNEIFNAVCRGIIDPGEMIGSQIATGLSEPLSQMTLNTFHLAGNSEKSKVNLGMTRVLQILNITKTDTIRKDLYMNIYFKPYDEANVERLEKIITRFNLISFFKLTNSMSILQDTDFTSGHTKVLEEQKNLTSYIKMKGQFPSNASLLSLRIVFNKNQLFSEKMSIFDIETELKIQFTNLFIVPTSEVSIRIFLLGAGSGEFEKFKELIAKLNVINLSGIKGILGVDLNSEKIEYRTENGTLKIREVKRLFAQGVNFAEILSMNMINKYRSVTNDIGETIEALGINAGKTLMYNELSSVYRANGASPSPSLLRSLISAMTHTGIPTPINSIGIKKTESSVIQQMTFEKAEQVIVDSSIYAKKEKVNGTSNNILLGQAFQGGTNAFKLIV